MAPAMDLAGLPISPADSFSALIGLRQFDFTETSARGEVPVRPEICQPWGLVHGGVYSAIAE